MDSKQELASNAGKRLTYQTPQKTHGEKRRDRRAIDPDGRKQTMTTQRRSRWTFWWWRKQSPARTRTQGVGVLAGEGADLQGRGEAIQAAWAYLYEGKEDVYDKETTWSRNNQCICRTRVKAGLYIYIEKALWIRACMQKHMDTRIGTETLWSFSRLRNAIGILLLDHSVKAGLSTYMTDKLGWN
jgi:hypothetical protein